MTYKAYENCEKRIGKFWSVGSPACEPAADFYGKNAESEARAYADRLNGGTQPRYVAVKHEYYWDVEIRQNGFRHGSAASFYLQDEAACEAAARKFADDMNAADKKSVIDTLERVFGKPQPDEDKPSITAAQIADFMESNCASARRYGKDITEMPVDILRVWIAALRKM